MMVALYDADDEIGDKRDLLGRTWVTFQDNFVDYKSIVLYNIKIIKFYIISSMRNNYYLKILTSA